MKRVFNIAVLVVAVFAAALALSCSNETDTTLNSQQNSIQKYLTGSHIPKLIHESDIPNSLDNNPEFYTSWGLDISRYISTYYDEGRDQRAVVEIGDKLSITYSAYIFTGSKPTTSSLFATNDPDEISSLEALGLNPEYGWPTGPVEITIGSADLLESLDVALEGCREGDKVEVYLTFEAGYGNKYFGVVPAKSALAWFITIESVTKK